MSTEAKTQLMVHSDEEISEQMSEVRFRFEWGGRRLPGRTWRFRSEAMF
jgi:hypothetical protein